jgi:large subunit ribosomal protein L29
MELKELKKKSIGELHKILAENRDKLRELRFKDANKQLKNVREVRNTRTIIAQVMTLLNAKQDDSQEPIKTGEQETINEIKK